MGFFARFIDGIKRFNEPLSRWFSVEFDQEAIIISANPPGKDSWTQQVRWTEIERVIFQGEGAELSDGVYLFSVNRPESYVVPTECKGGDELVNELISRGIFDSEKFTEAVLSPFGYYCWPDDENA